MQVIAVIPARFSSRRFPGKALVPVAGVPLVERVARQVCLAGLADEVVVATDDERIAAAVAPLDVRVALSSERFRSGSDRVAAAVRGRVAADGVVLNVQGDEAMVDAEVLAAALAALDAESELSTVGAPLLRAEAEERNVVKVLVDGLGRARAFSRQLLDPAAHGAERAGSDGPGRWQLLAHVGVYAFRAAALERFASLPTSDGEAAEDLEQLRALEHGMRIAVWSLRRPMAAVNQPADVARVEALLAPPAALASPDEED